jgi:hypothetical protein
MAVLTDQQRETLQSLTTATVATLVMAPSSFRHP